MGSILSLVSSIMYLSEKMTLYGTCTALICCLVLTITVTLGMGIGLGYNYCFVDLRTRYKYIKWHYIYPGSPRWPYRKHGNPAEQPAFDEIAEDEELRMGQPQPDEILADEKPSIPEYIDPNLLREYLRYNNTGNKTAMGYHPTLPDSESFNGTESSVKTTVVASTNEEVTEITENSPETDSNSNTTTSSTEDETDVIDETDEPAPEPSIVNEEQPESSPSSRRVKKLVIPISGLDLISLLSKLKAENKNYSLQIVTT